MIIIPQQFFGAGDAIFIISLLRQMRKEGDRILYPIMPQYVEGFNRAYRDVTFIDYNLVKINYEHKRTVTANNCHILPVRYADQLLGVPYDQCMRAKYDFCGLDWQTWREARPVLTIDKSVELCALVGATGEYNLISHTYGSNSQFRATNILPDNGLPNVYMHTEQGYSLFDWVLAIMNATTIHAVSSSIIYLLELFELKASEVHLYPRHHERTTWLKNIEYLLTKKYIIHD